MAQHRSVLFLVLLSCCLAALSFSFTPSLPSADAVQVKRFFKRMKNRFSTSVFRNCKVRTMNVTEYKSDGMDLHFPSPQDVISVRDQAANRGKAKRIFSIGCTPSDREFLMEKLFREGVKSKNFFDGIIADTADRRAAGAKFAHLLFSPPPPYPFLQCPDVVAQWLRDIGANLLNQNCAGINFISDLQTTPSGAETAAHLQAEAGSMTQQATVMQQQLRGISQVALSMGMPQGTMQMADDALDELRGNAQKVVTAVIPLVQPVEEPLIEPTQATITGFRGNPYYLQQ